jgi:hypothetical protein
MDNNKKRVGDDDSRLRIDDDEITWSTAGSEPRRPHLLVISGTPVTGSSGAKRPAVGLSDKLWRGSKRRPGSRDAEIIRHLRSL